MKKIYLILIVILSCSFLGLAQPAHLVLNSPESGTKVHQALNSITFAAGYSYTPGGGTMIAEIVESPTLGSITYNQPIDPGSYTVNTSLAVGSIPGVLNIGGSSSYTIPIDLPKGSTNLQPSINLSYISSYTDGVLGIGWNIGGLSAITRVNETIYHDAKSDPVRGDLTDKYALDGKRLIVINGTYGANNSEYRTEIEEFSKVMAYGGTGKGPERFEVRTKSGLIYEYGNTTDSKVKRESDCILVWKLNKITDRYNNYITFSYLSSDDEHPISQIQYTGNSSLARSPFAEVNFTYSTRDDESSYVYGGKEFTRNLLLDNIEIRNNGERYKKYGLSYMKDTHAQLLKVTGYSSQDEEFNPTVFAWTDQTEQFTQGTHYTNSSDEYYFIGDFNGDGRDDLVTTPIKSSYTSSDKWKLYLANTSGNMVYETQGDLNPSFETFMVADFNGDGLMDLMMQEKRPDPLYPNKKHYYFYESEGDGFARSTSYYLCYNNERLDVVDYNGDGKLEFMFHNTSNNWYLYTYSGQSIYSASIPSFGDLYFIDTGMHNRILDFNGDGCSDLLVLFSNSYKVYEFKGTNNVLVETYSGSNIENNDFLLFGDYNGDGSIDIIKEDNSYGANWSMLLLTNGGFQGHSLSCFDNFDINTANNRIYARDMNADGKTDVVLVGRGNDYYNNYNRINVSIGTGDDFNTTEHISLTTMQHGHGRYFNFGDFNGDGRHQLFYKYSSTSRLFSFASGTPSHLLNTVIDGLGAKTSLAYLPMSNSSVYTRGSGATYPVSDFSSAFQLVSQVNTDDGLGGVFTTNYTYQGAKVHRQGKGFLGFSKFKSSNMDTGISIENHYEFDGTYFYPQLRHVYTKYGTTALSTTVNTWNEANFGNKRIFPYVSPGVQTDNLTGLSVTTTTAYNSYGNPTSFAKNFGGGHTQTTTYAYNNEITSSWLIGRPTTITQTSVRDSQTKVFTTTRTYFSSNNSPDIDRYNSGDGSYWQLNRDYHSSGNLWKERKTTTGLSEQITTYSYDSKDVNLVKITDPAGLETGYAYFSTTGMLGAQTDPFGNSTAYNYNSADQFGTMMPDLGVSVTVNSSYNTSGGPSNARYFIQKAGGDGSLAKTWYDKLGREIRNETKSFSGPMVKVDKQYNSKGQLYRVSEPTTGTPSSWNVIGYDNYGRINSQDPVYGATTTFSYSNATTTRTVNNRDYTSTVDASGLVTGRTDPGGSLTYAYWPDGKLKSTLAPGSMGTSMTYDKNGNRLTINDPSAGTITNTWYGTGQAKTVVNPDNETTTYTYQGNGLLDYYTASPSDEGQTNYSYNTDKQVNSITSPGGVSRSYTYDGNGRVSSITESLGGVSNTITYNYDQHGRLHRKYFNGSDYEQYEYNSYGYLYRIRFNGATVWQLTGMDEYGHITQAMVGGTSTTWGYDTNKMLLHITASGVQQYNYSFDVNTGNLDSRTNFLKSKTESFGYDPDKLDRLVSVTGPVNGSVSYTTNKNGNILTKNDAGTYAYDGYAVSSISNAQNISTTGQEITYYSFEKVKKITEGTKTADFVYNANQQRIRMVLKDNGVTTKTRWYFGSSYEREQVGSTVTQYIWIGGDAYTAVAVAKKVGTGNWTVYNIFRDHLGTITHLKTGSTVYEYSFDAWGRRRDKDTWNYTLSGEPTLLAGRGFTGHEHLEDFALINMNGRLYDPVVGRFLSPDPYVQMPDFTQNFNRYSYALNNPLVYTDPSGEIIFTLLAALIPGAQPLLPFAIAADIGGVINTASNWKNIDNFWEGTAAYLSGAGQGAMTAAWGPWGALGGGVLTGGTNDIIAQTGNGVGLKDVDWGRVGTGAGIGAASSIAGYGAGKWATKHLGNAVIGKLNIRSPVASMGINGIIGGGAGGYAGGFTSGFLFSGGDINTAIEAGWDGLKTGSISGGAVGVVSGYAHAKHNNLNPWSGKSLARTEPMSLAEQLTLKGAQSGSGREIMKNQINDRFWKGWQKMQHSHKLSDGSSITIHYWYNPVTGKATGYKFTTAPSY